MSNLFCPVILILAEKTWLIFQNAENEKPKKKRQKINRPKCNIAESEHILAHFYFFNISRILKIGLK
jgi:hypothetical protein